MKRFLIASNIILIIAVIVLFFLHFTHSKHFDVLPSVSGVVPHGGNTSTAAFKMGYFELDSLDNSYKYEEDVQNDLIASERRTESQINDLQNQVQNRYNELQKKAPTMSQAEQSQYSSELNDMAQQAQSKIQRLQQSVAMERDTKMRRVKQTVQNYLKTYARENGYNYIVGTSFDTDNFYYKDSAQDITADLIKNLNQQYADSLAKVHK
jgi:outer membrane protein